MKKYIVIIIIFFIASCSSSKRSIKAINKGFGIDSAAASKRVREIVPCVTLKQDTLIVPDFVETTTIDTITRIVTDTVRLKCKDGTFADTIITKKYYDINHITNKANTFYITKTIEDKGKDIIIRDKDNDMSTQVQKTNFWIAWAIISTLLFLLSIIVLLIKKSLNKIP